MRRIIFNEKDLIIDSGIYYGRGVFETILVKESAILLQEHIDRLNNSIKILNIGEELIYEDVLSFIINNEIKNKAFKIVVTEKNIIYTTREINYDNHNYLKGFKVKFSNLIRNSTSRLTYIKSLNYLDNLLEYEKIKREGFDETIFLNEKGKISEGCTTNVFMVIKNKIMTPKIESGLLPGILRGWIIKNFDVKEVEIDKELLLSAEEIFLTNSLVGIIKVSELEGRSFSNNVSDKVRKIYDEFLMEVGSNG